MRNLVLLVIASFAFISQACKTDDPEIQEPVISEITPDSAPVDSIVIIKGKFFSPDKDNNIVSFHGTTAVVTDATDTQLTVTVPAGATTGKITVDVNGTTVTSANDFTVTIIPTITITNFVPASGAVGMEVVINGINFSTAKEDITVKFNDTRAVVTQATLTALTVTIPSGATTGKITVEIDKVMGTSTTDFTIVTKPVLPPPTISAISQQRAPIGTDLTITGTNFSTLVKSDNVVTFNDIPAIVKSVAADGTSLVVTVPLTNNASGLVLVTVNGVLATYNHPIVFSVRVEDGQAVRVKAVIRNFHKILEYVYDDNNVLIHAKMFNADIANPEIDVQSGIMNYIYNTNGQLISIEEANMSGAPHTFSDYNYVNGVCQSWTYSKNINNVKTEQYTHTFTWQNGVVIKDTFSDPTGGTGQTTYSFATDANGNPQTIVHYSTFDNVYTYYPGDIISPDPLLMIVPNSERRIEKTVVSGLSSTYNQLTDYVFSADGNNIATIHYYFPNKASLNFTMGYIFETVN